MMYNGMKRPDPPNRSKKNGYRHNRNPSIRTLMKSKRFESAAPKHHMMGDIIFSPHPDVADIGDLEMVTKTRPKIERLESVINRLRIENSHVMSKAETLETKTALLHKTLKHSKQQYAMLESETKKLKNHNKYLQNQLHSLRHKTKDDEDITAYDDPKISIDSLQKQLQNLQDTQHKTAAKNKKIKKSLEGVINDPGLTFHLRTKLLSILPQFYTQSEFTSPSLLSEQMKLDLMGSDREETPEESPVPLATPAIHDTHVKSKKLMHYKKRNVGHTRNLSESMSTRAYHTKILRPLSPSFRDNHQRSVSISNTSIACNIDSILSKARRLSISNEDAVHQPIDDLLDDILANDLEDLMMEDEETKRDKPRTKPINIPKSVPKPPNNRKGSMRRKKPPPPPRPQHANKSQSDHLNSKRITTVIKQIKPQNHLRLGPITDVLPNSYTNITNRIRSASEYVPSPSSKEASRSPPKLISIALETPQAVDSDEDSENYKSNLDRIQNRGRRRTKEANGTKSPNNYRKKAHTAWNPHMRSRSHQPFRERDASDSDFTDDSENTFSSISKRYMPPVAATPTRTRSKLFHIDLGWSLSSKRKKKEKKQRKESLKLLKKEESNLNTPRRSLLRSKKKKKSVDEHDLKLSETSAAECADDDMSDAVMNYNPLSPVNSRNMDRFALNAYKYMPHNGLLSSPEMNACASSPSAEALPFLHLHPVFNLSASQPNSPLTKPSKPVQTMSKSNDDHDIKAVSRKSTVTKPSHITRMDQIRMAKLQKKQNNVRQKRFYSAAPAISIANINTIKYKKAINTPSGSKESPVPGYHLVRRNSFSFKRRQQTDGTFDFWSDKTDKSKQKIQTRRNPKRTRKSNHTRSVSLRGLKTDKWSFNLSPRSRKSSKVKQENSSPTRKKMAPFMFGRKGSQDSEGSADSLDDVNKVWTLKDLIREMVSNNYDDTNRMRNALILCHSTFTSSVELFRELRRFFRMSITVMTSTILYFEDEDDEAYISQEDRRWQMRQKITHCIIYWLSQFWIQDYAHNKELQKEVELFKSDIRSNIHDVNRSNQLIETLMQILTHIKKKYGGINPKNLNLPVPIKRKEDSPLLEEDDDDKSDSESEQEEEYETSVVIHEDVTDEEEDEKATQNTMIVSTKTEVQQNKEMEQLTESIRSVAARFPDLIQLDIAVPHGFNIMELDPEDVAVQLTLLDSFVFKKINGRECIQQNWKKKDKAIRAPNVLKMIAQFNDVSKWVQMTVLKGETARLRKRYIKKMISMATYFMQNGNLSSLCACYNALTSTNINGLHATWKLLSKSKRKELQEIKALFGWKMSKFKEMQEEIQAPCIPHIGIILQTLFQIDEGKHNKNPINGSVNYIKMMMMHQQIDTMQVLQSATYGDEPNFLIQKLLIREFKAQSNITENALYKLAKQVSNAEKNQKK